MSAIPYTILLSVASASRMMLSWNCDDGPSGGFVSAVPEGCEDVKVVVADILMKDLAMLTKTQGSGFIPSLQFINHADDLPVNQAIESLDDVIMEALTNGEKLVIIGKVFGTNAPAEMNDAPASVDRKVLQSEDPKAWIDYPEKLFPDDCGAIKIGPDVTVVDSTSSTPTTYKIDSDPSKWLCDTASSTMTIPTDEGKQLLFKFGKNDTISGQYQIWTFLVEFDGDTFGVRNNKDPIVVPKDTGADQTWSWACTKSTLSNKQPTDNASPSADDLTKFLSIGPYQVQSGKHGKYDEYFSRAIDCTPLLNDMVWVTVVAFFVFILIFAFGAYFVNSIEIPQRFETARSKPLIIPETN